MEGVEDAALRPSPGHPQAALPVQRQPMQLPRVYLVPASAQLRPPPRLQVQPHHLRPGPSLIAPPYDVHRALPYHRCVAVPPHLPALGGLVGPGVGVEVEGPDVGVEGRGGGGWEGEVLAAVDQEVRGVEDGGVAGARGG